MKKFSIARAKLAEWLHPQKDNPDYWLMKSLGRKDLKVDIKPFIQKHGKKKTKDLAQRLETDVLLNHIFDRVEQSEVNFITKEIDNTKQFFYSRAIIHVITTIKEKISLFSKVNSEDEEEFNKFEVV